MKTDPSEQLVTTFKALADPIRLRMVALLVEGERCGQELAGELSLAPATVSHHLRRLRAAGLVRERKEPPYVYYAFDHEALRAAVLAVTDAKKITRLAEGLGPDERKVIDTFFDGDRLSKIPAQRRKKEIVFEELLRRLPRREVYTEKQLSRLLQAFNDDFCTIRRELIMGRYMERERGRYRLAARGKAVVGEAAAD